MKKLVLLFSIILMSCSNDSDEGSKMQFTAGGLIYKETSQEFD